MLRIAAELPRFGHGKTIFIATGALADLPPFSGKYTPDLIRALKAGWFCYCPIGRKRYNGAWMCMVTDNRYVQPTE